MTITFASPRIAIRSPGPRRPHAFDALRRDLVIGCATIVGLAALAGAIAIVSAGSGNAFVPHELLARTPFDTFLLPGLLLGVVVGGASLACALLTWRRSRFAIDATLVAGAAISLWILVESVIVPASWLQALVGALGITLLVVGIWQARAGHHARHRWLVTVTCAETVGYLAPAVVGILVTRAGWSDGTRVAAVIAAGCVEGFALGIGQGWALPLRVRRLRFALLTSLGGGLVWAMAMLMMQVAGALPAPVMIAGGVVAGMLALASIGTAQWLELRHHAARARPWIAWTALAWLVALPMSFAPGPFVDASTPLFTHVVLWGCGGVLMAFAMAVVTWQGARRFAVPTAEGGAP